MMPVGAVISAIMSNVSEAAMCTAQREYQLDSIDILLRCSAGWLPWKKRLPDFCFDARQPVSVRLQASAFLMSTFLFPTLSNISFYSGTVLPAFYDPGTVGFLSQTLQPLTFYLR